MSDTLLDVAGGVVLGGFVLGLMHSGIMAASAGLRPESDGIDLWGGCAMFLVGLGAGAWLVFRRTLT